MKLTAKIQKAIDLASMLHIGQVRKGNDDLPYISHPFSVAWILSEYSDDEDVIVAGLLHDVLEDVVGYDYDAMCRDFGFRIADIVKAVSEDKDPADQSRDKETWIERKEKYLDNLRKSSPEAMLVSGADKIHNLTSMIDAYKIKGDGLWARFNSPADKKIWFYEEVAKVLRQNIDNQMVDDLDEKIEEIKGLIEVSAL